MIYDLAFWQNQIKMRDDCAVRYSIRVLRDVVVLSVRSRGIQKLRKSTFKSFDPSFKMSSHSELAEPGVPGSIDSFNLT